MGQVRHRQELPPVPRPTERNQGQDKSKGKYCTIGPPCMPASCPTRSSAFLVSHWVMTIVWAVQAGRQGRQSTFLPVQWWLGVHQMPARRPRQAPTCCRLVHCAAAASAEASACCSPSLAVTSSACKAHRSTGASSLTCRLQQGWTKTATGSQQALTLQVLHACHLYGSAGSGRTGRY